MKNKQNFAKKNVDKKCSIQLNKSFAKRRIYARRGLSVKCVKATPTNSCHWNSSIQKGRFMNGLKYNSEKELL